MNTLAFTLTCPTLSWYGMGGDCWASACWEHGGDWGISSRARSRVKKAMWRCSRVAICVK